MAEINLTFEKALEVAVAVEAADNDVKQLQIPSATVIYCICHSNIPYSTKLCREKTLADLAVHCQSAKVLSTKTL